MVDMMDYHDMNFVGQNTLDPFYGHNRARMAREQEAHVMTFEEMVALLPRPLTEPPRDSQEHPPMLIRDSKEEVTEGLPEG